MDTISLRGLISSSIQLGLVLGSGQKAGEGCMQVSIGMEGRNAKPVDSSSKKTKLCLGIIR